MLLPADLSSTASVPGVSLYMNSNSNNKIDSIANCTLHYAMSPDIEFAKKGTSCAAARIHFSKQMYFDFSNLLQV